MMSRCMLGGGEGGPACEGSLRRRIFFNTILYHPFSQDTGGPGLVVPWAVGGWRVGRVRGSKGAGANRPQKGAMRCCVGVHGQGEREREG